MVQHPLNALWNRTKDKIQALPGIRGGGLGKTQDGQPCVVVYTNGATPQTLAKADDLLEGAKVCFEEMPDVSAQPAEARPASPGKAAAPVPRPAASKRGQKSRLRQLEE